jgi:hypothetical protein
MLRIIDYIKALLPRLDKSKVQEDLRVTSSELSNAVIPTYQNAAEYFKLNKIKSDEAKNLTSIFYSHFNLQGGGKKSSLVEEISKRLPAFKDNTDYVLEQAEELFEKDIIKEGLTAKKAILLRAADYTSFVSRYSLDLLNYLYAVESKAMGKGDPLPPATIKYITSNISKFAIMLSDYSVPNKDFRKLVLDVPEINIGNKNAAATSALFGNSSVDPFSASQVQGFVNPIYHVRLMEAEWQASRYKANKEKKKLIEMQLLHLKLLNDGKSDPKIEEEIEYLQSRVDKLGRYLLEVEESLQ